MKSVLVNFDHSVSDLCTVLKTLLHQCVLSVRPSSYCFKMTTYCLHLEQLPPAGCLKNVALWHFALVFRPQGLLDTVTLITEVPMEEHAGDGRNGYHVVVGAFRRLSKLSNFSYLIFLFF